ncbi:MAG TPA: AMP-binding protein [Solirubrobacterales bacterium]|nr:AMP-binding protein [Solirubrobacterales bacterium]
MLQRTVTEFGERPAVVCGEVRWTYAELDRRVRRFAAALLGLGVEAGERVGLLLPNGADWIVANLATLTIGAVCVPINARLRAREIDHVLRTSPIAILVTTEAFLSNRYLDLLEELIAPEERGEGEVASATYPSLRRVVAIGGARGWTVEAEALVAAADPDAPRVAALTTAAAPDDAANVFWTSGSTGLPKGVVTSHRVLGNVWNVTEVLGVTAADRCLVPCPLFYVAGYYWCLLGPIMRGACAVVQRDLTPEETLELIEVERATTLIGVADAHRRLLGVARGSERDTSSLRAGYVGGGKLTEAEVEEMRALGLDPLCTVYGMTETGGITTMTDRDASVAEIAATIGRPLPGFELRLVDPEGGEDAPLGAPAELWVRSPFDLVGYEGAEPRDPEEWFATGDLVERDADGPLTFAGRSKDVVKVGGENVTPAEVEEVLREHERIDQVAVVGVPDPARSEVTAAVLVLSEEVDDGEIVAFCRARLAPFKVPRHLVRVERLPHTATGKVARAEVKALAATAAESS